MNYLHFIRYNGHSSHYGALVIAIDSHMKNESLAARAK